AASRRPARHAHLGADALGARLRPCGGALARIGHCRAARLRARHRPVGDGSRRADAGCHRQGGRSGQRRRGAGRRRCARARLHEHGLPARHLRGLERPRRRAGGQPGRRRTEDGGGPGRHEALAQQGRLAATQAATDRLRKHSGPGSEAGTHLHQEGDQPMSIWRRIGGAAALAALIAFAPQAAAGPPGVLVSGDNLPANVDPHQVFDVPMQLYSLNVYDNLYRYEGNPPKLEPWLAQSHTVSADGLTWEFKLRPGAKFHDGSEITADDVVYSFKRVLAIGKAPAGAFKPVLKPDNITAVDKSTVKFVLDRPYAPFLAAIPIVMIVNPRVVKPHEKDGDW